MTSTDTAIELLSRLEKAICDHDVDAVADCFSVDYETVLPLHPGRGFRGRDQVHANYTALFRRVPDLSARVLAHATDGDAVWSEWEMHGTRADGTPEDFAGVVIWWATDGRVSSSRFYLDPVTP